MMNSSPEAQSCPHLIASLSRNLHSLTSSDCQKYIISIKVDIYSKVQNCWVGNSNERYARGYICDRFKYTGT